MRITQPNEIVLTRLAAGLLIAIVVSGVELRGQSGRRGSKPVPMPTPQPAQPTPADAAKPAPRRGTRILRVIHGRDARATFQIKS